MGRKKQKKKKLTIAEQTVARESQGKSKPQENSKPKRKKHPVLTVLLVVLLAILIASMLYTVSHEGIGWIFPKQSVTYASYEDYSASVSFQEADIKELRNDPFFYSLFEQIVISGADDVRVKTADAQDGKITPFLMYVKYTDDMIPDVSYKVSTTTKKIVESSMTVQEGTEVNEVNGKEYLQTMLAQIIAAYLESNDAADIPFQVTATDAGIFVSVGNYPDETVNTYMLEMCE